MRRAPLFAPLLLVSCGAPPPAPPTSLEDAWCRPLAEIDCRAIADCDCATLDVALCVERATADCLTSISPLADGEILLENASACLEKVRRYARPCTGVPRGVSGSLCRPF